MIDGADNVFSLRRKELFSQCRLGAFLPKGLNERAAGVELDMFVCGVAYSCHGIWCLWGVRLAMLCCLPI